MSKINNINRRKFLEIFAGCTCGLMIGSCSTAPITERKQLKKNNYYYRMENQNQNQ